MTMFNQALWGVLLVPLVACGGARAPAPGVGAGRPSGAGRSPGESGETIAWRSWGPEVFAEARAQDRLVMLDVGIEGCTACRWMYEDTYRDAAVVRRVRAHFVPVSVDADVLPDVGERFAAWGWPATIFLRPDGTRVMALRGNKRPHTFIAILDELLRRQREGTLEAAMEPPEAAPLEGALGRVCNAAVARLDRLEDTDHGGWGRGPRIPIASPVLHALYRARTRREPARRAQALRTLEGWSRIMDPVWGGVFVAARAPDWSGPIPEKRILNEAAALDGFAAAYAETGDPVWLERIALVHRYMHDWMTSPEGTFFSTQEDDAPRLPRGMSAADYYRLGDAQRRRYGIPPIDHAVYTDQNAQVIEAYVHVFEATADTSYLDVARRAADALLASRTQPGGWVMQVEPTEAMRGDARMRAFLPERATYLAPQVALGQASLALHRVTGDAHYLTAAARLGSALRERLEDTESGGFWARSEPEPGLPLGRRRPFYDNIAAARFLLGLYDYTKDDALWASAERTLRVAAASRRVDRMGSRVAELALAISELELGPVEFTVLGSAEDPAAAALFDAALRVHEPRKVLHYEAPGRYPDQGRAAMFICTHAACSNPIVDPAQVARVAARFEVAPSDTPCGG